MHSEEMQLLCCTIVIYKSNADSVVGIYIISLHVSKREFSHKFVSNSQQFFLELTFINFRISMAALISLKLVPNLPVFDYQ